MRAVAIAHEVVIGNPPNLGGVSLAALHLGAHAQPVVWCARQGLQVLHGAGRGVGLASCKHLVAGQVLQGRIAQIGRELAGRANATINFTMFVAAFASQYLVGFIIGLFPVSGTGYSPEGYSWAIGVFLVAQLLAFGWYLAASPHREKRA